MRVILVTGANGGIGQAIARAFLEEHPENFVWLAVHKTTANASKLASQFNDRTALIDLDITDPVRWEAGVKLVLDRQKRIDVLVNNAGKHRDSLLANLEQAAWEQVISTNLGGVFNGCRAVLPAMISQRHGRIINIASLSALLAPPGQTNYAAAKAGVVALTQSLAKEVARIGITVNAVCPGYIETEALSAWSPEERTAAIARVPMRRLGKAEEVAVAVRFLACRDASYITGSVLKVDGGIL